MFSKKCPLNGPKSSLSMEYDHWRAIERRRWKNGRPRWSSPGRLTGLYGFELARLRSSGAIPLEGLKPVQTHGLRLESPSRKPATATIAGGGSPSVKDLSVDNDPVARASQRIGMIRRIKGDWNGKKNLKHNFTKDNVEVCIHFSIVGTSA